MGEGRQEKEVLEIKMAASVQERMGSQMKTAESPSVFLSPDGLRPPLKTIG